MASRTHTAFTLVELLVVVAIIALLLAMLVPSLENAYDTARKAACASNEHHMSLGVALYAGENQSRLMQSLSQWGGRYGLLVRFRAGLSGSSGLRDELSLQAMAPYVAGVELDNPIVEEKFTGLWWCPAGYSPQEIEQRIKFMSHHWNNFDYSFFGYSYFARVGDFEGWASRPDDLTDRRLDSHLLLLSDAVYYGSGAAASNWYYHHGSGGASLWDKPLAKMSGANQAYGDGSVNWKPVEKFNIGLMSSGTFINSPELGALNGVGNVTYW